MTTGLLYERGMENMSELASFNTLNRNQYILLIRTRYCKINKIQILLKISKDRSMTKI